MYVRKAAGRCIENKKKEEEETKSQLKNVILPVVIYLINSCQ